MSPSRKPLYATLWRWHFYAGLFCIPFVLVLSLSGALYLFKPQLDAKAEEPYHHLAQSGDRASPTAQIEAALKALPGSRFASYRLPQGDNEAVRVTLQYQGQPWQLFVDPYRLTVLGKAPASALLSQWAKTLHGELLAGTAGALLVELAGSWALVLVLTGLYLWWPRGARGLGGLLYPRFSLKGRAFWRDLHSVVGIWVSALALFLLITALPWTSVWGGAFKALRAYSAPVSQDWTTSPAEKKHHFGAMVSDYHQLGPAVLAKAQSLGLAPPVELSVSDAHSGQWKVASDTQNRPLRATAWLAANGSVLKREDFSQKPLVDRVIGVGIAAHEGQLFGWANQLLGLMTALALSLLSLSGLWLWLKRKPSHNLGAPPSTNAAGAVTALVLGLSLVLPMLLASLLMLLALEWALLKRIPRLRRFFNLAG